MRRWLTVLRSTFSTNTWALHMTSVTTAYSYAIFEIPRWEHNERQSFVPCESFDSMLLVTSLISGLVLIGWPAESLATIVWSVKPTKGGAVTEITKAFPWYGPFCALFVINSRVDCVWFCVCDWEVYVSLAEDKFRFRMLSVYGLISLSLSDAWHSLTPRAGHWHWEETPPNMKLSGLDWTVR